ncbi:MAG: hypothetical protein QW568_01200 [Candidatus Anstonellaceae archaeon]
MAVEFRIDQDEAFEMIVSILAIALAFVFSCYGLNIEPSRFLFVLAAYVITVGSGFILHELAHKYYGIKYGARARFKAWPLGLALGLGLAIIPQIFNMPLPLFIAPGAVYIYAMRHINPKENGIISLAGPAMNWAIAFVFLGVFFLADNFIVQTVALIGVSVNLGLAFFNLIPIFPLDGSKVMAWNWKIWLAAILFAFVLSGLLSTGSYCPAALVR